MAGKYKWDAWKKNEGKSSEQAKKEYVEAFLAVRILGVSRSSEGERKGGCSSLHFHADLGQEPRTRV